MSAEFDIVWLMARRTLAAAVRRPVLLSFSLGQPLIWMLFFGFLFERYQLADLPRDLAYLDFLAPGVATMTVLFGASQSGIGWIRDLHTGFLPRLLNTPARPGLILAGKILADTLRLLIQAGLVLVLAGCLGFRPHLLPGALLPAFFALALFGCAFCALSSVIALKARAQEAMAAFVHLVNMPLFFTSTALVPARHMPGWLAEAARWNPLTLAVEALRDALVFGRYPEAGAVLPPLAALAGVLCWLAAAQLRRAARHVPD